MFYYIKYTRLGWLVLPLLLSGALPLVGLVKMGILSPDMERGTLMFYLCIFSAAFVWIVGKALNRGKEFYEQHTVFGQPMEYGGLGYAAFGLISLFFGKYFL